MRIGSVLFLLGILTLMQFRELPPLYLIGLVLILLPLAARSASYRLVLWYGAGFAWALFIAHSVLAHKLEPALEGVEIVVQGRVVSLPAVSDHSIQFELDVEEVWDSAGARRQSPGRIRLNWYRPYGDISAGDTLRLGVSLKRPHGYMNPGGFDYEAWLFQKRIRATGYVRRPLNPWPRYSNYSTHKIRQHLRTQMQQAAAGTDELGLILALTIGDQNSIDAGQWRVMAATGTGHLLSISGLHIGLVAGFGFFLVRWLWPLFPQAVILLPAQHAGALASIVAAVLYAMLAGFTIPTQRSLLMVLIVIFYGLRYRRVASIDVLAWALLGILLLDPLAVHSIGFWLSFSAVVIILYILNQRTGAGNPLQQWGRIQLAIYIGLIPVLGAWFNQFPLTGLLANSIAIPWVSFVSIPVIIMGMVLLLVHTPSGTILLLMGGKTLDLLWQFLTWLEGMDVLQSALPQTSPWVVLIACLGAALLFLPRGIPVRWTGALWLLPMFITRPELLEQGDFELTVLDVGQGLAAVIRTREHALLYDTGPGYASGFNAGRAVVIPFLRNTGTNIDMIIQSHGDADHIGGLVDVLAEYPVMTIYSSIPDKIVSRAARPCLAGRHWVWDGVRFEILHPDAGSNLSENDASCVVKISGSRHTLLLTGDIESRAEYQVVSRYGNALRARVLVAPHHGSATSSSNTFIQAVRPDYVIFSTGYLNRFRLPKQDIISRYRQQGAATLNTAQDGAITIRFTSAGTVVKKERQQSSRFWNMKDQGTSD